jgi:hypothetical protein
MKTMPFPDLEQAYEALAEAIDSAGPGQEALFLAKLALTLAHRLGDLAEFKQAIGIALQDLPLLSDAREA